MRCSALCHHPRPEVKRNNMQTASHTVRAQHSWEGSSIEGHIRPLPELVGPCAIQQVASPFLSNVTSEDLQVPPAAQAIVYTHSGLHIPCTCLYRHHVELYSGILA